LSRTYHLTRIENLGYDIIVQRPKLREHIDAIRANLAQVLQLEMHRVSVKAKTAVTILGELGSGDAIIAQASVLISEIPC
jgi:2-C-methyl-D-erythritol 2,4-cyclodiphosphate synthase